jgi:hypothetical protein
MMVEENVESKNTTQERMSGQKANAQNVIAVVEAKKEEEAQGEPKVIARPKFFIKTEDRVKVELVLLFNKRSGEIVNISLKEFHIDLSKLEFLGGTEEWFEFSRPSYDEISSYRQKSMVFDKNLGRMLVDPVRMRNFLIIFHLKSWSIRGDDGSPIVLTFNERGALDDDSVKFIDKLHPTILDIALSKFETEILLQ